MQTVQCSRLACTKQKHRLFLCCGSCLTVSRQYVANFSASLSVLISKLGLDWQHSTIQQVQSLQVRDCYNAGMYSPRHLAVPVRLPAPLLPRPTPQPRPHHHASRQHAAPPCSHHHTPHQKCHSTGAARGAGQGRGQVRGLLGPGALERGGLKGSKQGKAGKAVGKGSNGCRAVVPTRQQEESWQTRCAPCVSVIKDRLQGISTLLELMHCSSRPGRP